MTHDKSEHPSLTRRSFLLKSAQVAIGLAVVSVPEIGTATVPKKRSLTLLHTHTNQHLEVTYAWGGKYNPFALAKINKFLRDYKTGQTYPIDPKLLDILWAIQQEMGRKGVYEVISGFRSPQTNGRMRRKGAGVARNSLHMKGKAIDIRFPGISTNQIQQCAVEMQCGGVGYYAKSDFVHLDTGQFRTW